jgi:hypothetical protein
LRNITFLETWFLDEYAKSFHAPRVEVTADQKIKLGNTKEGDLKNTKFIVKLTRVGAHGSQYLLQMDKSVKTTSERSLALVMGKYTAQDAIDSIQSARCVGELIPVKIPA